MEIHGSKIGGHVSRLHFTLVVLAQQKLGRFFLLRPQHFVGRPPGGDQTANQIRIGFQNLLVSGVSGDYVSRTLRRKLPRLRQQLRRLCFTGAQIERNPGRQRGKASGHERRYRVRHGLADDFDILGGIESHALERGVQENLPGRPESRRDLLPLRSANELTPASVRPNTWPPHSTVFGNTTTP